MSVGSGEGLDGARAERLSDATSEEEEEEWSSSEECFSGVAIESSPSACSARGAYSEEPYRFLWRRTLKVAPYSVYVVDDWRPDLVDPTKYLAAVSH